MSIRRPIVTFLVIALLGTGCGTEIHLGAPPSPVPPPIRMTVTGTGTARPTDTPPTPPPTPMAPSALPVEGVTTTQVNVRAEPSTAGTLLGMIPANTRLEITGKDPGENWWQVKYPQGVDGKGWVTAQYVTTAGKPDVPTVGARGSGADGGSTAVVQQQLNVRSGPGTDFNSLGTLNPEDVVNLVGRDPNGAWLQINFSAGPEGKAWVNAAFVRAQGADNLPIITEAGLTVGTATPTTIPSTPTATLVPARPDNDSPGRPIASVAFQPSGTQAFQYDGDLSAPRGDLEDWIAFKPYDRAVFISLACKGTASLRVEMTENSLPIDVPLGCGSLLTQVRVNAGSNYLIHLRALTSTDALQYSHYTLRVTTRP